MSKCIKCKTHLQLGAFAHNQNICWACFKETVLLSLEKLKGEERETVVWMLAVVAEIYNEK